MTVAAAPPLLERHATVDLPSTAPAEAGNPAEVHTLLTNGESVLLQTALAYVSSPSGNVPPQRSAYCLILAVIAPLFRRAVPTHFT